MSLEDISKVRFYRISPLPVKCMSINEEFKLLAVARSNNTIEIWNLLHSPHIQRTIVCSCDTIESIAWYEKRLFSVGLQGNIVEYDLLRQAPKPHPVISGTCRCITIFKNKHQLAAGTESGFVNIYDIKEEEIVFNKLLNKQEGKIISLSWDATGNFIVTGSIDTIRVWNVETGQVVHRMLTGRSVLGKETIVWALAVTDDFTIISGDSRGKLCFWDGNTGLNTACFQSHKADVRAISLTADQNSLHCAGTDPLIAKYERVKIPGEDEKGKWVRSVERVIHGHEIRSLVTYDEKLFSAGSDGYIALSCYESDTPSKDPPLLQTPVVHTSKTERLLLLRYSYALGVWRLGEKPSPPPVQLIHWQPPPGSSIKCAALSDNGKWLACSTQDRFRLYSLQMVDNKANLTRIKLTNKHSLISHAMTFSSDSRSFVLGTVDGNVIVIDLTLEKPAIINIHKAYRNKDITDSFKMVAVSSDSQYIVAADLNSNIIVWRGKQVYAKLPRYDCPITALTMHPNRNELIIVYSDHKVMEYCLNKRKYTDFNKNLQQLEPKQYLSKYVPVVDVTFDREDDDLMFIHDDTTILAFNKDNDSHPVQAKCPRLEIDLEESENSDQNPSGSTSSVCGFQVIKDHKHLVYFGQLGKEDMIAIEVYPMKLTEGLPPTARTRNRFGRM